MRTGPLAILLCLGALLVGCGDDGVDDKPAVDASTTAPARSSTEADSGRIRGRAEPIAIRIDGRVFKRAEPELELPSGRPPDDLIVENLIAGAGAKAGDGDELTVEYVGIHYDGSYFTNSWERSKAFSFVLGGGNGFINPGWEKGLKGMRVGERRELIVPPKYLFRGGPPPEVTAADTLVYVVDLLAID
jgi:FKBP-type peptidyl-prolyl cis-trans isomerase